MSNGVDEPGFRITLSHVWNVQQEILRNQENLRTDVRLMDQRMNVILGENKEMRDDLEKLKSRFNGVLVGIGTGIIVGVPTLIALLGG